MHFVDVWGTDKWLLTVAHRATLAATSCQRRRVLGDEVAHLSAELGAAFRSGNASEGDVPLRKLTVMVEGDEGKQIFREFGEVNEMKQRIGRFVSVENSNSECSLGILDSLLYSLT